MARAGVIFPVKIEGEFHVRSHPLPHEKSTFDELVDDGRRLMAPPFSAGTRLEGRITAFKEHVEPFPGGGQAFIGKSADAPVAVDTDAVTHGATKKLVDGNAVVFPSDIPERLVNAGYGGHEDGAASEEGRPVHVLPVVLDAQRILADQVVSEFPYRAFHALGLSFEGSFTPAR